MFRFLAQILPAIVLSFAPNYALSETCAKDNLSSCDSANLCVEAMKSAPNGNWAWRNKIDDFVREADRRKLDCAMLLAEQTPKPPSKGCSSLNLDACSNPEICQNSKQGTTGTLVSGSNVFDAEAGRRRIDCYGYYLQNVSGKPPELPAEYHCQKITGKSKSLYNTCIDQEQEAYDFLSRNWSMIDMEAVRYCEDLTIISYALLKVCVEQEMDAGRNRKKFKY
jgi:hypothetical protein